MDFDGLDRTGASACIAACAEFLVDGMWLVGRHWDGVDWAMLRADGAAGAIGSDLVTDQGAAAFGGASALQVCLILRTKVPKRGEDWIGCGFSEAAEAAGSDLRREAFELDEMFWATVTGAEAIQEIQHAPSANAAKGAFPAGLLLGEAQEVAGNINHAIGVIEHHQAA
jgi:hypothetical protein